jgi:hypothetical protein
VVFVLPLLLFPGGAHNRFGRSRYRLSQLWACRRHRHWSVPGRLLLALSQTLVRGSP